MMKFTDSHCHLDFEEFDAGYCQWLSQCALKHIHQIIIPAVSPDNWQKVLNCCSLVHKASVHHSDSKLSQSEQNVTCFPALGIHPWYLRELDHRALNELNDYVAQHRESLVAIGETGIDLTIAEKEQNLSQQIIFFKHQISLAKAHKLPLILHHRKSHALILKQLKADKFQGGGIIHAFSGSYEQAKQYIDLGFYIGVGGTITYPRAQKTIKAISKLPLDSLVLETDAPAMPLQSFQGEMNTPLHVIDVFTQLANIRCESGDEIAATIENNIKKFLAISKT